MADAQRVQAVVFDLDGVLIDTEELWDEVRRGLAAEHGRPWPDEATRAMQGMSTGEWSGYLAETVGIPGEPHLVATTVIDRMAQEYHDHLPLLPGAVEAVRRLGARWPLGLASSSPRRLIDAVLDAAGLAGDFAVTLSTEEVAAGKPDPAVYREAAGRMGVAPERAVAIEDSSSGLRAASAAGLGVIALPNRAFPPADDALALADVVIGSLAELTPDLVTTAAR